LASNSFTSTLSAGTHSLSVNYPGPVTETSATLVVNKAPPTTVSLTASLNPSIFGMPVEVTATVSAYVSGIVTIQGGGITIAQASGTGAFLTADVTSSTFTPGTHHLTAFYSGDSNNQPSSAVPVDLIVKQISTTITLMTSGSPSTFGQTVTLMVTVSGSSGTPTGNVSFSHNGVLFLGPVVLSGGQASPQWSAFTVGSHSLTASYGGDPTYQGSVSNAVNQVVNRIATTTSLQAVPASPTPGQSVTLTATVSPSTAGGTVTFSDGANTIGSAGLTSGTAIFFNYTPSIGSHSLIAAYSGDTNDAPSSSPAVPETVGQNATITFLQAASYLVHPRPKRGADRHVPRT